MHDTEISAAALEALNMTLRPVLKNVTVVIPTLGRPTLLMCLREIAKGTVWPARIVVVDQGRNTAVVDWLHCLRQLGIKTTHVRSTQRSPASARNVGILNAHTAFIAAIDDDCLANEDWLEKMDRCLGQYPTAIITGRVNPANAEHVPSTVTSDAPVIYRRPGLRRCGNIASGNMGFALHIAQRIGPFDEDLLAAEDNDWAYRALRAGIPIVYAPEVIVCHQHWRDKAQLTATYRTYAWSEGAFYGKHLRRGDWLMALRAALYFARGVRLWMRGTVFADYGRRASGRARVTHLLPGLIAGLRRGARKNIGITDDEDEGDLD